MKLSLLLAFFCLALHHGEGAPRTAVYKFVRCNPEGDQANCVTHQSPEMAWSTDLPAKLPASTAQYLEAEPVEGESPSWKEGKEEVKETPMMSEEGESPMNFEGGSGGFEGSADGTFVDWAFLSAKSETGSGESWRDKDTELYKGGDMDAMRRSFPSWFLAGEAKPEEHELKEDHLLQP
ncbi:serglycin [Pempheris klunzingeri]|uniref:serglycin n=1 Tax=Pempheris klunzingeri TaxID=3127111 RepID=UPI0039804F1D